jgi:pilus assembly protein CpaB
MHGRALLVAIAFALLGVASLAMYAKQLRTEISGGEKVSVLIMSKAGKRSAALSDDDLAVREVPIAYVDDRFIRASEKPKVLGLKLERQMDAQEILEWQDLALAGQSDRHLSQLVDPGARAFTLHIPAQFMSVELLRPGDYVDLISVHDEKKGTVESVVLLQKVLVLAVGVETTPTREAKQGSPTREEQILTVSVTLQDSQAIALALQKGPIIAVLRSPEDPSVAVRVPALSRITLREQTPTPTIVAPPPKPSKLAAPGAGD